MKGINLEEKFSQIDGYWQPRIAAELNGQYLKLAKFKGEFDWHSHANEDEYFQVFKGQIKIHLRDKIITLEEGDCCVVPKGVEHKPVADEEAHVIMFEPKSTEQTGGVRTDKTVEIEDQGWI